MRVPQLGRLTMAMGVALLGAAPPAQAAHETCTQVLTPGGQMVASAGSAARGERTEGGGSADTELPAGTKVAVPAKFAATIPVVFHIISKDRTAAGGFITDAQAQGQVDVLNRAFGGFYGGARTGFRFALKAITRSVNAEWYAMTYGSQAERAAKSTLHRGGAETLNLYSVEGGGLLGWAVFPKTGIGQLDLDGVVFAAGSIQGGTIANYDLGQTATHEVGHWLGLLHTFQNGCSTAGDRVQDTPAMVVPTRGCPEGKDSCPSDPGTDPIHNYMDYSYDACYTQFTAGQARRMAEQWLYYRAG